MSLPIPIGPSKIENRILKEIEEDLIVLKAPTAKIPKLAQCVYTTHQVTGINPKLIVALMKTESDFNENAVGPKNRTKIRYKGILQTPTTSNYTDVDILHGVRILEEKLKISNNDLPKALALYKGGDNKVARKQANEVLKIYKSLQK
jgi:soluble lytic murein transglycosylase-like protein